MSDRMKTDSVRFILLMVFASFVKESSGCCCNLDLDSETRPCYCNVFGCNCLTTPPHPDDDYCYFFKFNGTRQPNQTDNMCKKSRERCPDKRRKRSLDLVMEEIMNNSLYTKLYGNLMGNPAIGVFYHYDLNKVSSFVS